MSNHQPPHKSARSLLLGTSPFDAIASEYDAHFTESSIGRAQRESVWRVMDRVFRPGQCVLEMNCGTGVDALHLAAQGICVLACDASPAMLAVAQRRREGSPLRRQVDLRRVRIEEIGRLENDSPFDGVLSNFAGLNCVANMRGVVRDLARLVKPGGMAVLCVFGRFCLWEMLWYTLRGDLRKAIRRLRGAPVPAQLAPGHSMDVHYPSVGALRRDFAPHFRLVEWKGVGIAVPPSYVEPYAARFPRLLALAARLDAIVGECPGLRGLGDHIVLVFERARA